jgi:hypothetical protein
MTINKERVELFAQALESDRYRKCSTYLRAVGRYPNGDLVEYNCALGVATHVALDNGLRQQLPLLRRTEGDLFLGGGLATPVRHWYGFLFDDPPVVDPEDGCHDSVTGLNDAGRDFWTIAQALRAEYLKDEG